MNVEIGTEAAQLPEKKYINGLFVAVWVANIRVLSYFFSRFNNLLLTSLQLKLKLKVNLNTIELTFCPYAGDIFSLKKRVTIFFFET